MTAGKLPIFGALGAALLLATGCASVLNPKPKDINEERGLGPNNSVQLGAATRSINTTEIREDSRPGQVNPRRIVCAEPSPDVATTIAQSITASFNAAAKMDNPQGQSIAANAAGNYGQSSAQGALQLGERLATVTLLRDSLHRACEAYANGALTDMSYSLILSRYHATMVTMLNSELTAGAFGRELGALTSEASHALGGLADDIQAAQRALEAAQLDVADRTKTQAAANARLTELMDQQPQDDAAKAQQKKDIEAQKLEVGKENKALADAKNKEFLAKAEVEAAKLRGASGRARVDATNVKGIDANVTGERGDKLLALTKQFNESGVPEAMLVACITAMDSRHGANTTGVLPAVCATFLDKVNAGVEASALASARIKGDLGLETQRVQNDFRLRLAQINASVVGDIAKLCSGQKTPEEMKACISTVKQVADAQSQQASATDLGAQAGGRQLSAGGTGAGATTQQPNVAKASARAGAGPTPVQDRAVTVTQIPTLPRSP